MKIQISQGREMEIDVLTAHERVEFDHNLDNLRAPVFNLPDDLSELNVDRTLLDRWEIEQIMMKEKDVYRLIAEAHKRHSGLKYGAFRVHKLEQCDCAPMDAYRVVVGFVIMDAYSTPRVKIQMGAPGKSPSDDSTIVREWTEVEPAMDYQEVKHLKTERTLVIEPGKFLKIDRQKWQPIGVVFR